MLFIITFLACVAYFLYYIFYGRRKGLPPGPMPLPILGNLHQLDMENPAKTFEDLSKKYGNVFTFWMGVQPNVVITGYNLLKDTLLKHGDLYTGRNENYVVEALNGGRYGLFASDGPLWKEQRRFTIHILRDFGFGRNIMEERILDEVHDFLENHLEKELLQGESSGVLNVEWPLKVCIGNIINLLLMGYRFEHNDKQFKRLVDLMESMFKLFARPEILLLGGFPWLRYIPLFGHFGNDQLIRERDEFTAFLQEELDRHKKNFNPEDEPLDYTSAYLKEMDKRKKNNENMGYFSEWQLMMSLFTLWSAGLETTVTTLKWGFLRMLHHPEVQEKCRAEILMALEHKGNASLKYSDRLNTPYTCATIMEIQRASNILPMSVQNALMEDTVLEGFHLKKGTTILPATANIMIDPEIFPEPELFKPERFMESGSLKKCEEFIPFSIGRRNCLGESLAKMELYLVFGNMLRKYKLSLKPGSEGPPSLKPVVGITMNTQPYEILLQKI